MTEQKSTTAKKSGMVVLKPGDVLFKEKDHAQSLYIIQSGQIRLFRPKGKGFVDIAILRTGEVIGEMAFFDVKNQRRSTSASAIVTTKIIEISFAAFSKTMQGLNPWFKTIITTLAERLRKANETIRSLESNSVGFGRGGKIADYVFLHNVDIIKILSTMYLVTKNHGKKDESIWKIHLSTLSFYLFDIYAISEIKWEEFLELLKVENFIEFTNDEHNLPRIINYVDLDSLRSMVVFFNSQRRLEDSKKLTISNKCEMILKAIMIQLDGKGFQGDEVHANIGVILEQFKAKNVNVSSEDLADAIAAGLCDDIMIDNDGQLGAVVRYETLKKSFPPIRLMNAIKKLNDSKKEKKGYE